MTQNPLTDPQSIAVGFVGLGQQGGPMAANLVAAGYRLIVRDADPERERRWVAEHGGRGCGADPAGLADVEILITMLPNGQVVRDALLGEDQIASRLRPGTIVVDTSSSDPYGTRNLGAELAANRLILLDSPVTRPEAVGEDTRRITFMVGGDDDGAIDRVMPLLEAMAERIFRAGPLGSGHAMKTLNNYVSAAGLAAALDAMIAAQRFGVDVETMLDVFNAGTARNFSTANTLLDEAMSRRYAAGFQLALMVKDLRIATSLFEHVGFDAPLSRLVRDQFAQALGHLHDQRADLSRSLEDWERRGEVRLPGPRHATATARPR
ncbi:MAG TPA: NAD(P)-dependent oxidoreductase [Solirubrobacteraceae bacterium]|nr:NAD(P)-dependent oxidoreductase [Solirubrobacteraceae bacterium]